MHRYANQASIDLIKSFEGFVDHIYICPAGWKTIAWGHALKKGEEVRWPNGITEEQAVELLKSDIYSSESSVQRLIYVELTEGQFGALVSFTFNLGGGALQRSSLRSKLNRYEYFDASEEFCKWVRAGGRISTGLIRRREAERLLFLS
jgi:lysozyme